MGVEHRSVVIIMYVVTLLAAGLGMLMMVTRDVGAIAVFAGVSLLLVLAFRVAGAVRLRKSISVLQRNLTVARETKRERREFEDAQLRIREATSFDVWWSAVCKLAEEMEFVWVALSVQNGDGGKQACVWRRDGREVPRAQRLMTMTVPVGESQPGVSMSIELAIDDSDSLETIGRRATLFGRLLDEQRFDDIVPMINASADSAGG